MAAEEYLDLCQRYLKEEEQYLSTVGWTQASEKFWGAAAVMVKAVSKSRDWVHDSHRHLFRIVSLLSQEGQDGESKRLVSLAHHVHTNFYENWLHPDQVKDRASAVRELVLRLPPLVNR